MEDFDNLIEDGFGLQEEEEDYEEQFVEHYAGASKRPLAVRSGNVPFSSAPPGHAAKRAKASATFGLQEQQPPAVTPHHGSNWTRTQDRDTADDLMAEIDMGGSLRPSATIRCLYQSATGMTPGSQAHPIQQPPAGMDASQGGGYSGGFSETQTQLSQDTEAALAESLATEAAAAAVAASMWLPPARSSISFPGDVISVTAQSEERVYCQVRDPREVNDLKAAAQGRRSAGGRAVQLLARPMRELMIDAEERLLQRTLRQSAEEASAAALSKPVAGKLQYQGSGLATPTL